MTDVYPDEIAKLTLGHFQEAAQSVGVDPGEYDRIRKRQKQEAFDKALATTVATTVTSGSTDYGNWTRESLLNERAFEEAFVVIREIREVTRDRDETLHGISRRDLEDNLAVPAAKVIEIIKLLRTKEAELAETREQRDHLRSILEINRRADQAERERVGRQAAAMVRSNRKRLKLERALDMMLPLVKALLERTESRGEHAACAAALEAHAKLMEPIDDVDRAIDRGTEADRLAPVGERQAGHPGDRPGFTDAGARDLQFSGPETWPVCSSDTCYCGDCGATKKIARVMITHSL